MCVRLLWAFFLVANYTKALTRLRLILRPDFWCKGLNSPDVSSWMPSSSKTTEGRPLSLVTEMVVMTVRLDLTWVPSHMKPTTTVTLVAKWNSWKALLPLFWLVIPGTDLTPLPGKLLTPVTVCGGDTCTAILVYPSRSSKIQTCSCPVRVYLGCLPDANR